MGKYSIKVDSQTSASAKGTGFRTHFKNTRETAAAIRGLSLSKAQKFLRDVIEHKDAVPFRVHTGGIGRHAQAKKHGVSQCRWPEKSCKFLLGLLQNAQANAEFKNLDTKSLVVSHIQVNQAPKHRRRIYRAHGRINPFLSSPSHIELVLTSKEKPVKAAAAAFQPKKRALKLKSGATGFQ